MSIHDFHSKLESSPDSNALFAALRRLSTLENPQDFFDAVANPGGWPRWDQSPISGV
jgi:hypothetical protein